MSNLENLTKKILDDASHKASNIIEEAETKSQELLNVNINEANNDKDIMLDKAKRESILAKERIISNAELKARNDKLSAKQEVVDKVFNMAKDRFNNIGEEEFINFVKNNIKNLSLKGTEVLIVPERFLEKAKLTGMRVSGEEFINSGFLLKDNDLIFNYSFEALVDFLRENLEIEVAQMLFKE